MFGDVPGRDKAGGFHTMTAFSLNTLRLLCKGIIWDNNNGDHKLLLESLTSPLHCYCRYKLMKWWAQSFLVGVPKIVCGFRDDDGIVKSLQNFKTSMIPHDSQVIGQAKVT